MAITVYPVTPSFAAEIGDIDLATQIEPANLRAITDALARYAVLRVATPPDLRLTRASAPHTNRAFLLAERS